MSLRIVRTSTEGDRLRLSLRRWSSRVLARPAPRPHPTHLAPPSSRPSIRLPRPRSRWGVPTCDVTNLTAPGVEPHDLELTPDQIEAITTADLVLYLGGGFQPAVEDAIGDAQGTVVDVSEGLRDLPVPDTETSPGLTADPHVWLDPVAYSQVVGRVESALAEVDPFGSLDVRDERRCLHGAADVARSRVSLRSGVVRSHHHRHQSRGLRLPRPAIRIATGADRGACHRRPSPTPSVSPTSRPSSNRRV